MKKILLIFSLYIPLAVLGQCKVQFLIDDSCTDSTSSVSAEIALLDSFGSTIKLSDGICNLSPGLEAHVLISVIRNGRYMYLRWKFIVPDKTEFIKTFKIPILIRMHLEESVQSESRYFYCNDLASGYYTDSYDDDQLRIKGNFNDGMPIGKLYTYHRDGKINYIANYSQKGKFRKSKLFFYDESGLLKEIIRFRNFVDFMIYLSPSQGGAYGFVGFEP